MSFLACIFKIKKFLHNLSSTIYLISGISCSSFKRNITLEKQIEASIKCCLFPALSGLTATENFFLQYGQFLKELDLSILTTLWNEKYGSKFDYVSTSSEDKEVLDYFSKPPLQKARCFIWLLELNRENFPSLHQALDEFFDKMGKYAKVSILIRIVFLLSLHLIWCTLQKAETSVNY